MKTTISGGRETTTLEPGDRQKLRLVLRRLGLYAP